MSRNIKIIDKEYAYTLFKIERHKELFRREFITSETKIRKFNREIDKFSNEQHNLYLQNTKLTKEELMEQFNINEKELNIIMEQKESERKLDILFSFICSFWNQLEEDSDKVFDFKEEYFKANAAYYVPQFDY